MIDPQDTKTDNINTSNSAHAESLDHSKKKLLEEYKEKSHNSEIYYYTDSGDKQSRPQSKGRQSTTDQSSFWKKRSPMEKIVIIVVGSLILLLIIATIVIITVEKSSNPDDPPTPTPEYQYSQNPYVLGQRQFSNDGGEIYTLSRDKYSLTASKVAVTPDNSYLDNIQIHASLISYQSLRLQITDQNTTSQYRVPESFLDPEYLKSQQQGLNFSQFGFKIENKANQPMGFSLKLYDTKSSKLYLDSSDQNFIVMTTYQEIGFNVNASSFYGLGERMSNFSLNEGSYSLFPYFNKNPRIDNGSSVGNQLQGQHPFLLIKLNNGNFIGIFLFNSNPQQFRIKRSPENSKSTYQINIITTGGILDLFVFTGPSYNDVIKQYQNVIGKPKLLPIWSHAFQSRSSLYTDQTILDNQVYNYSSVGLKVEVLGLPTQAMNKYTNFDPLLNLKKVRENEGLQIALPYFYFIPDDANNQKIVDYLKFYNLTITSNVDPLIVFIDQMYGYCADYFNPDIYRLIQTQIQGSDVTKLALWLDKNTPYIDLYNFNPNKQPFEQVPFSPSQQDFDVFTVPPFAQHTVELNLLKAIQKKEYHYNLHGLYGTQMAKVISENLPKNSFVISSSTFPGSGRMKIAHQLPQSQASWDDLAIQLNNLLNFNMFGIPYTGHNICGYIPSKDQDLCVRSFQLSVITPLAILNQNSNSESDLPYSFSQVNVDKIQQILHQRTCLLVYQRTEIYKISQNGGSLLQPMSLLYSNDILLNNYQKSISFLMYGSSIKADFELKSDVQQYDSYFPFDFWLSLRSYEVLQNKVKGRSYFTNQIGNNKDLNLYQKPGTIIPLVGYDNKIDRVQDIVTSPLHLSILVNQSNYFAQGHVLLESGNALDNEQEFYEITHQDNMISFKQQNNGFLSIGQLNKNIDWIKVSGSKNEIEFACVLKNDLKSTQILYIKQQQQSSEGVHQAQLSPGKNQQDTTKLWIDDILFIFYSSNTTAQCVPDIFRLYLVDKPIPQNDVTFFAKIRQNLQSTMDFSLKYYDLFLNITLLSDHSLYIFFAKSQNNPYTNTPTSIYDRNFTEFAKMKKNFNLSDILFINQDPFFIEIHSPQDSSKVLWSTKDQILIFHETFHVFSYIQPNSNSQRFYGLQERRGQFFLQDKYTYSLYTNNQNLEDKFQSGNRVIQHGRNGAHPVVFSQFQESANLSAYVSFIPSAVDFIFNTNLNQPIARDPRVTHISPFTLVESVFIFNITTDQMTKALHKHIVFGNSFKQKQISFPPPAYTFGWYLSLRNYTSLQDIKDFVNTINNTYQWPQEGLMFDNNYLDRYQSLTIETKKFNYDIIDFIMFLKFQDMKIFNILKSGISEKQLINEDIKNFNKFINKNVLQSNSDPIIGKDQTGDIQFLDHTAQGSEQVFNSMIKYYKGLYNFGLDDFGIQLQDNEIQNTYCDRKCFQNKEFGSKILYKPGTDQQFYNNIPLDALREAGQDTDIHNLNGLLESFHVSSSYPNLPFTSSSTAIGFGKISNAGRLIEIQRDLNMLSTKETINTLVTLGALGVSLTGISLNSKEIPQDLKDQPDGDHVYLCLMLPLCSFQIDSQSSPKNDFTTNEYIQTFFLASRMRYSLILYTQTQLFKSSNFGDTFIQPLFYQFPDDPTTYTELIEGTFNQFMYGPSFKVYIYMTLRPYFPKGVWCTTYYSSMHMKEDVNCIQLSVGDFLDAQKGDNIYLKSGTITPLQNPYDNSFTDGVKKTKDIVNKQVDLHLLIDPFTNTAKGDLFLNTDQQEDDKNFCFFNFNFQYDNLKQKYVLNFIDSSQEMKSSLSCQQNDENLLVGDLYIYNAQQTNFQVVEINSDQKQIAINKDPKYPSTIIAMLSMYKFRFTDIQQLLFA